jgi:membrane protein implicated in regulation of membrane protease activity
MDEKTLRTIKIIFIIVAVFGAMSLVLYGVYAFSLLWQTFAAGITISFLLIIIVLIALLAIYLWIRTLLNKRELNRLKNELEQAKIELKRCESKFNQQNE